MVTMLAGVIAVLGTSILFLSSESLNSFFGDVGRTLGSAPEGSTPTGSQSPSQEQSSSPVETQDAGEQQAEAVPEPAEIECEALNVSGDYPVLQTGEECFKISNVHTWVNKVSGRINERSTTAFIVQNTGTKTMTISSITLSDVAVPTIDWFFTTDPVVVKPANLQKDLPMDYTEGVVTIGGGLVFMKSGAITLEQGQGAIVYLNEAGGITEKDVGLLLTLQVQAAKIQVVKVVPVVRA